jgi:hypothetical protein
MAIEFPRNPLRNAGTCHAEDVDVIFGGTRGGDASMENMFMFSPRHRIHGDDNQRIRTLFN